MIILVSWLVLVAMDGSKSSSLSESLCLVRKNRARDAFSRCHPAIRQKMLQCFCLRPGKVYKSKTYTDDKENVHFYVMCGHEDKSRKCMYYQWIDSRWLGEADATVTADATLQAVHLD